VGGLAVNAGFWRGRRVLITGHTGFKGSWLSLWLQRLGAEVCGLSRGLPTEPALFERARVGEGMTSIMGDILDRESVASAVAQCRPEVVIHLAAQPIVRASFEDPIGTYATNVMGTAHVLDAVRLAGGVRVVVNVTTDKVYENREWEWAYREDEALGGHDPYASSKACSEVVTIAYRRSFFGDGETRLATARAGNVIGGGDWARDRLIPDLLRGAASGDAVRIRSPHAIRPWQHVLNPLEGYLTLVERLWDDREHAHGWNFGPDSIDDKPVGWIADRMSELLGDDLRWERDPGEHVHEAHYLRLDSSLAWARLGWMPRWDLEAALTRIVDFFRAEQDGAGLRETALAQIEDFEQTEPTPRGAQAWL
jgi:CDP-glucose 4,6-dehydratase